MRLVIKGALVSTGVAMHGAELEATPTLEAEKAHAAIARGAPRGWRLRVADRATLRAAQRARSVVACVSAGLARGGGAQHVSVMGMQKKGETQSLTSLARRGRAGRAARGARCA